MQRLQTTVIALVGRRAGELAKIVGGDANARAVPPGEAEDVLDRAADAWRIARRTSAPFLLHDADPLTAVADAWVGYYDEQIPLGSIEVAVAATVQRWRAGSLDLPDYYLVLDPDAIQVTRRHFYLGYLHQAAPSRVVPSEAEPASVREAIASLRAGLWWDDLDRLLAGVERVAPSALRLAAAEAAAASRPLPVG